MSRFYEITCAACDKEFKHEAKPRSGRIPKRCPECREKDPKGHDPDYRNRLTEGDGGTQRVVGLFTAFDRRELEFIMAQIGNSKSDALKTAVRVYAALLRKGG